MITLKAGDLLDGRYRLVKPLGKGGEGSVWLAVHLRTAQPWAVKVILREGNGQELHELEMMRQLRHPSLPRVVDVLETEEAVCLVMEYIHGRSLEELMAVQGRLTRDQVLDVGLQVGEALSYLHGRSVPVLHLDVKPANVIRKKSGRLVLVDFGAAVRNNERGGAQGRRGTVGFAAPEQYNLTLPLSRRTDLYGLGATMYYLMSGAYYRKSPGKNGISGCPDALYAVLCRCLEEEPNDRYDSAEELCRALAQVRKSCRRRKRRYSLWVSLILMGLAAGLALREIPREFAAQGQRQWNYEELLEEALCVAWEDSFSYYQKAVFVKPVRKEAYLQYIRQADRDGVFDSQEEEGLRTLLHTIPMGGRQTYEEMLSEAPDHYGEVASVLGMIYWYDYEQEGGRAIGAGWFTKAAQAGEELEEQPQWALRAKLFAHMGSYFDRMGKKEESIEGENWAGAYWEDLKGLMELDLSRYDYPVTVLRFCREALTQIAFGAGEIRQAGVEAWEMEALIGEILGKAAGAAGRDGTEKAGQLWEEIEALGETALEMAAHLASYEAQNSGAETEQAARQPQETAGGKVVSSNL